MPLRRSDFHYDLPLYLVAQQPPARRSASRMLCLDPLRDAHVTDLPEELAAGDLLVFNDSGEALGSIAYGVDVEIPIKGLWDALPDIRLTGGGMVYYQKSDGRVYGLNTGLRYDF